MLMSDFPRQWPDSEGIDGRDIAGKQYGRRRMLFDQRRADDPVSREQRMASERRRFDERCRQRSRPGACR
jgi:hypothetical protein